MIEIYHEAQRVRATISQWRGSGQSVAFVPTMGNLHAGHMSLVRAAQQAAQRVVVSIFVNPTQFAPNEDFSRYPRTQENDTNALREVGCDLVWIPDGAQIYPLGMDVATSVHVPFLSDILEGAVRPGHFDGVCTVVARLFHYVQPDMAVFGQKDYQQVQVLAHMVEDLAFPVRMVVAPTVRAQDGLALSSRNQYLSSEQRKLACALWQTLVQMRDAYKACVPYATIEHTAHTALQALGFKVDYAVIRHPGLLAPPAPGQRAVALVAVRLGETRLIDNVLIE